MSEPSARVRNVLPPPLPPSRRGWRRFRPNLRQFRSRFSNDLLGWEVLRAGRRTGTLAIARTAIGGLLLAAMWALWSASFGSDASLTGTGTTIGKQLTGFAEWFAITFFVVQAIAVLLLTPVFVAGAIFEERDTRSGEILLTTELTRREVYVGKIGARMVQVLLVILASMPILFLTQLWGGVSLEMILVNYSATCIAVIGAGVVTAALSAYAETMRAAILRAYGVLFLLDVLFFPASPFLVIGMSTLHWGAGLGMMVFYLPLQLTIVVIGYFIGQRWLRMAMLRQKTRVVKKPGVPPPLRGTTSSRLPPLTDNFDPLLWKELNVGTRVPPREALKAWARLPGNHTIDDRLDEMGTVRWVMLSRESSAFIFRLMLALAVFILFLLTVTNLIPSDWVARVIGGIALAWLLCAVGLSAATGISRERQKQTLIDVLMLPGPRRDLLKAKALGALSRGIWPGIAIVFMLLTTTIGLGTSLVAVAFLVLVACGLTFFSVALGIWLSARCRTALNATATWIGLMSALLIGTFLLAEANQDFRAVPGLQYRPDYPGWSRVANPLLAWGRLAFRYDYNSGQYVSGNDANPWPLAIEDILPALLCPLLFATLGGVLWTLAVRRFEKEGRS